MKHYEGSCNLEQIPADSSAISIVPFSLTWSAPPCGRLITAILCPCWLAVSQIIPLGCKIETVATHFLSTRPMQKNHLSMLTIRGSTR